MQAARADAVGALFVFLHLLERDAEFVGERRLAEAKLQAPDANARANENIGLCRAMFHMAFLSALRGSRWGCIISSPRNLPSAKCISPILLMRANRRAGPFRRYLSARREWPNALVDNKLSPYGMAFGEAVVSCRMPLARDRRENRKPGGDSENSHA